MNKLSQITNFDLSLAPMVGLSHAAMRGALSDFIPNSVNILWPTEMLSSRRLPHQDLKVSPETIRSETDRVICPQILGNDQQHIQRSILKLEQWGANAIDINMGCPVKKALKHNYGVSLMGDAHYASKVVKMAVNSSNLPVSVKLRAGMQSDTSFLLAFVQGIFDAGASWVCLHPRSAQQKRKGRADWSQIKLLKDTFKMPIIGNGDIQQYQDIEQMFEQTNCDNVMIGRALCAKPWLLTMRAKHLGFDVTEQEHLIPSSPREDAYIYGQYLKRFITLCFKYFQPNIAKKRINFFLRVGSVWLNFGHSLSKKIFVLDNEKEMIHCLDNYFKNKSIVMNPRSQLRY